MHSSWKCRAAIGQQLVKASIGDLPLNNIAHNRYCSPSAGFACGMKQSTSLFTATSIQVLIIYMYTSGACTGRLSSLCLIRLVVGRLRCCCQRGRAYTFVLGGGGLGTRQELRLWLNKVVNINGTTVNTDGTARLGNLPASAPDRCREATPWHSFCFSAPNTQC